MKSALTVVLFRLFTIGVFVDGKEASNVSVMEGDSVTLKSGVTGVQTVDDIEWRFKTNRIDKFVDGLQLNNQTGDLKISNIRTKDSGLYKVKISSTSTSGSSEMEFNVTVGSADEVKRVSVMEGDSVTLQPDPTYIQRVDEIRWRFGKQKSLVAKINRIDEIFNKLDGPDERFRDRLELDNLTGSLTITNIRTTDSGLYEAEISSTRSRYTIHYTQSFSVTGRDEVKSVSVLEGDSVTLRTGLTGIQIIKKILWKFEDQDIADLKTWSNIDMNSQTKDLTISNIQRDQSGQYKVEIITRRMILHRKYRITIGEMKSVSVKEGGSVTLQINVTKIQSDDLIYWMFGNFNLAKFNKKEQQFYTSDGPDERFRCRLKLDNQTGSLNITDTRTTDSGDYQLKIISSRHIINRKITVTVSGVFGDKDEVMSVMKGNRVTLNTGVTKNPGDVLLWYFEYTLIAQIGGHPEKSCLYYGKGEIFKDRLDVDYETGSLIITTSRPEHTGRYQAEFIEGKPGKTETIIRSSKCDQTKINPKRSDLVIHKSFILTVSDAGMSPGAVAGIVVAVVLLVVAAAGVVKYYHRVAGFVCYRCKISERQREENGGNPNKQNTDEPATEETKMTNDS